MAKIANIDFWSWQSNVGWQNKFLFIPAFLMEQDMLGRITEISGIIAVYNPCSWLPTPPEQRATHR